MSSARGGIPTIPLFLLGAVLFLGIPSHPFGFADGFPWDSYWDYAILLALAFTTLVLPPKEIPWKKILPAAAAVALLKIASALLAGPHGFAAKYFPWPKPGWDRWEGEYARSVEYPRLKEATRVDRILHFANHSGHPVGARPFPIAFFNRLVPYNDIYWNPNSPYRSNYFRIVQPLYPFSAEWTGALRLPAGRKWEIRAISDEPVWMSLGNGLWREISAQASAVFLEGGIHGMRVRYRDSDAQDRHFRLEIRPAGSPADSGWRILPAEWMFRSEQSAGKHGRDQTARWIGILAVLAAGAGWLGWWAFHLGKEPLRTPAFWARLLCWLLVAFWWNDWAWLRWPRDPLDLVAARGDDPLQREEGAQIILLERDPFLRTWRSAFFDPPGGHYILALVHLVSGEGFQWAGWWNWAALGWSGYLGYLIASRWFRPFAGLFACGVSMLGWMNWGYASYWYPDLLVRPMALTAILLLSASVGRAVSAWKTCLAGGILGAAVWIRPNLLASWILAGFMLLARSAGEWKRRMRTVAWLMTFGLPPLVLLVGRNYFVGGEAVLTAKSMVRWNLNHGHSVAGGFPVDPDRPLRSLIRHMAAHPVKFSIQRIWPALSWGSTLDSRAIPGHVSWKGRLLARLHGLWFFLGIFGMVYLFGRGSLPPDQALAVGFWLGAVLPFLTVFNYQMGFLRYWQPAFPIQYIFAAGVVSGIAGWVGRRFLSGRFPE